MPKVIPRSSKVTAAKHRKQAEVVDTGAGAVTAGEGGDEKRETTELEGEEEINVGIAIKELSGEVEIVAGPAIEGIGHVGIATEVAIEEKAEIGMNLVVSEPDVSQALQKKTRAETEGAIETRLLTKDAAGVGKGEIVDQKIAGTAVATLENQKIAGTAAGITENQKIAGVLRGEVAVGVGEEAEAEDAVGEEAGVEMEEAGAEEEEKESNKRTNKNSVSILLRRPPVTADSKNLPEVRHRKSPLLRPRCWTLEKWKTDSYTLHAWLE